MRAINGSVRKAVVQALACASGLIVIPGLANADPAQFDIVAQPLPNALKAFAAQAKMQLLYRYDIVSRANASAVAGKLEKHAALDQMLRGTGLEAVYSNENTATIRLVAPDAKPTATKAATSEKPSATGTPPTGATTGDRVGYVRLAQADNGVQTTPNGPSNSAPEVPNVQEVVITGVRVAIETSQEVKKDAATFVDSISATDLGAFPDKSASDALQRLPGITVNRLQSNDDSTHPSGEPTNILIRGLTQVRTEFNGRDTFSADSGRGLNFNDISPELLARADAYKNQTADMIEGGIAGTVDLRTRLPFDQDGHVLVAQAQGDYGDRSKQATPAWSILGSDSIWTDVGRFGLLADYARSHVIARTQSVIDDKIDTYCSAGYGTAQHATVNSDGSIPCTANPFGGTGWAFVPDGVRYSQVDYDRTRIGNTIAAQYETNDRNLVATVQYEDSNYHNAWLENASHAILEGTYFGTSAFDPRGTTILGPATGTGPLVFGSDGMLQSGVVTQGHGSWAGSYSPNIQDAINTGSAVAGVPFVNDCGPGFTCSTLQDGLYFQDEARDFDHREDTKDFSANVHWDITGRLHSDFDAQYVKATVNNNDILVATGSMANYQYSVNGNGTPQVNLLPGSNVNYAPGGLSNPTNYWIPFIQGHVEDDDGHESAFRTDFKYDIDKGGWLDSVKAGIRYADRDQSVRYSTFNWTPIAANWNCNGPGFSANATTPGPYPSCASGHAPFLGYGAGIWGTTNFNSFYNSSVYPNGNLVFLNKGTITNFSGLVQGLSGATTNSPISPGYVPICDRPGVIDGCFLPSEVMQVDEKSKAGYIMLNFGGPDANIFGHVNVVGNVGVRIVETQESSGGSIGYPTSTNLLALAPCGTPLGPGSVVNPSCYLTPQVLAFASGGGTPNTYTSSHTNALPSFNVRFGLDDKDFLRFAYSRAISRPDMGFLRNYVQINSPYTNDTGPNSPYVVYNSPTAAHTAANVVGYNFVFNATAGNAGLLPEMADQFDLSFERYYGPSSAVTLGLFFKKLSNTLSYASFDRTYTNNGATETVQILGPINEKDGGRIKGLEAAWQTFFDFLPGLWSGLGMQANYTHVVTTGINNSNLIDATSGGGVGAVGAGNAVLGNTGLVVIDSHQLAGVSKDTYNLVGLYEKGPIGLRLAYNWRSRYLTDNLDCCIGLPVFQKAAGFLDGSVRYSIGSHIELSLDVTNLLNTKLEYQQQIFGDTSATPGAAAVYRDSGWSVVDRRYQFGVRAKF